MTPRFASARRRLTALLVAALALAGCASGAAGVELGREFQFVAPGGQLTITYDPPESRGRVSGISGESVLRPGETVALDDYQGKVVVLNIWGSWCGPCREEMPDLQLVQDQLRDSGVAVLGLDVRDDRAAAEDFRRDRGITFDSIYDPPARNLAVLRGYPRNTVPSTIVFDRQHRVAAVFLTRVRVPELLPVLQRLAAE